MGKIIKGIFITVGIIVVLCTLLLISSCSIMVYRTQNYWKYAETGGGIEAKYTKLGAYEVSFAEFEANNDTYKKYEIWYPSEIKNTNKKYPLVIMANGTGVKASQYKEVFKHLSSWGFIVAGNEDDNSRTGASSSATLDFILSLNDDSNSEFYQKIDTANVGIGGHSQGGVGAVNAVTEQSNGNMYKTIYTASATSRYHAAELNKNSAGWNCNLSNVHIPIFMVAGTKYWDAGDMMEYSESLPEGKAQGICPLWWLNECYDAVSNDTIKVVARQVDKDHGDILRSADGYMTAWFMWHLQGDEEAGKAFYGENAEILNNEKWQDVKVNP